MATLTPVPLPPTRLSGLQKLRASNTLDLLKFCRAVLFVLAALLLAAVVWATGVHRHSMQVIGKDTAPSIIAAQQIKSSMADMDADAADDLLNPGSSKSAGKFDERRVEALDALIVAAKNITYDAEQAPLETLQVSIGNYTRLIQEARDLQDDAKDLPDEARKEKQDMAIRYYRAAGIVMDGTVLPAADDLDKANNDELEREYASQSTWSLASRTTVLLLGLALLAVLVFTQLFISRRTRRTINPGLLGATVVAFGLTVFAFGCMAREQSDLHAAKDDAFASVHALLQARATAYAANSDESRYLLDRPHAAEYDTDFKRKTNALLQTPAGLSAEQLMAELRSGDKAPGFSGLLADELNNITYPGERESAIESVARFEKYMEIDGNIRALATKGQIADATALDVGSQEGQSDWAFDQFDQALGATLKINRDEFDTAVSNGFSALAHLEWEACLAALVVAVLIFLGFAPRIREYE